MLIALPAAFTALVLVLRWPGTSPVLRIPQPTTRPRGPAPGAGQLRLAYGIVVASGGSLIGVLALHLKAGDRPGWDYALPFLAFLLGWLLLDLPLQRQTFLPFARIRRAGVLVAAHLLLVAALATSYLRHPLAPFLGLGAVLAYLWMWVTRRRSLPLVFWLVSLALLVSCIYLDAWWFAAIGDEYAFYDVASMVLARLPTATVGSQLYNPTAVYGSHPGVSVLLQAASLRLFGDNVFGWRFGGIYLTAVSLIFLYPFYRTLGRARLAFLACALLAASHYLMSFGKIGYNNLQALFAFSAALGTAAWVVRSRRPLASLACGVALGLAFYVYPGALLTLPIPLLYLGIFDPPNRDSGGRWATLTVVFLAAILPMLLQPAFWATKWAGTLWNNPALVASWQASAGHVLTNFAYASLSFLLAPIESHFVAVGYLDVVSAGFVLLGLGSLLRQASRRPAAFVLVSLCILLLLVGALHDYGTPTTTRMFLLLPWFVLLGALGLVWLEGALHELGWPRMHTAHWTGGVLVVILGLNLLQAYPLSRQRMAARYQSFQVVLQREAHVLLDLDAGQTRFVFLTTPGGPIRKSMLSQLHLHRLPYDPRAILELPASAASDEVLTDHHAILMITPWVPRDLYAATEARLRAAGKRPCRFRNSLGWVRLVVWVGPEEKFRCADAAIRW